MNTRKKIIYVLMLLAVLAIIFLVYIRLKADFVIVINEAVKESYVDLNLSQFSDKVIVKKGSMIASTKTIPLELKTGCNLAITINPNQNGEQVQYQIKLINQGNILCTNASVSTYYDDSLDFVSSTPVVTASNYYWELGDIGQGETKSIIIVLQTSGKEISSIDTQVCATADNATDACTSTIQSRVVPAVVVSTTKDISVKLVSSIVIKNDKNLEYGSWVWVSPIAMSQEYMRTVVEGASQNGINVLYVTIDDYLEIEALTDVNSKNTRKKNYINAIERFVRIAKEKNISVELEAGWRDWAEGDNRRKAFVIADFVIEYNNSHVDKIKAIQYDIEPYLLSSYTNDKTSLLENFISLIDEVSERLGNTELGLSVVIPHFYDEGQAWTPAITYKGINTYAYDHILRILDTRKDSKIIIMAYRNFAEGNNGSIDLAHVEIDEASSDIHSTKIIVGQESGDVKPDYVTFFSLSKAEYLEQKEILQNKFSTQSGFGGIAIHYIDSFLNLK